MEQRSYSILLFLAPVVLLMSACDAIVSLPYMVKNKTHVPVDIRITDYQNRTGCLVYARSGKDTVITLKHGEKIMVSCGSKIDFPWGARNIYRQQKGVDGFDLLVNGKIINIDKSDKHWKYIHGESRFRIRKKMLQ